MSPARRRFTLTYRVALLVALLLVASALVTTLFTLRSVETTVEAQSEDSVENVHSTVGTLIAVEYSGIQTYRDAALQRRKDGLVDVMDTLVAMLEGIRADAAKGVITEEQAKDLALRSIPTIRYGNNDYVFTFDTAMTAIAHPDAKLQGRNLIDLQDTDGKFFIQEMRDVALNGGGYLDYKWIRLGEEIPSPKIARAILYEPWDWILGTGLYVDDIDAEAAARLDAAKAQLGQTLGDVTLGDSGFFMILDESGNIVLGPPGTDLGSLSTTPEGRAYVDQVLRTAPATDGQISSFTETTALDGRTESWVTNVSRFEPLGWVLVSAVPQADLVGPARSLAFQLLSLSLVVLLIGLVAGLLLSRRIVRPVEDVTKAARALAEDRFDPAALDRAATRQDEVGELARTFQRMGTEVVERERVLREQVARLRVEIDRTRVDEAVSEITETEYFQQLRERAESLRRGEPI
ncbi:MAG: cache domain-containing protein [Actinomycetales bacterium]|nr:cache domain-containing protein [Actinomycetales bacterium]